MKVILCEDVDNLGSMGETVNVAPGYARNFLLPRKYAVTAESASAKQVEHELRVIKKREEKLRTEQSAYCKTIDGAKLEFIAKASQEGKLFGSITTLHIADRFKELGHDVDRKKIVLKENIKSLGDHAVTVRVAKGIEAKVLVTVARDADSEVAAAEPEFKTDEELAAQAKDFGDDDEERGGDRE